MDGCSRGGGRAEQAGQWGGAPPGEPSPLAGPPRPRSRRARLPLERLQVIVPALAATGPLRLHLDPPAVIAAAAGLICGMVDCLPAPNRSADRDDFSAISY